MPGPDRGPLLYAYRPIPANPTTVAVLLLGLVVRIARGYASPHRNRARDERGPPPPGPLHPGIHPRLPRGDARLPRGDVGHPGSVRAHRRPDGADGNEVLRRPGPRDAGAGAR